MRDKKRVYHLTELKDRRRDLRTRSTNAERLMWQELRNSKLGVKFRRQFSVMGYVIDFYSPKARLGIELLGGIHDDPKVKIYDKFRKRYLEAFNIKIIEFKNEEIENEHERVIETIRNALKYE